MKGYNSWKKCQVLYVNLTIYLKKIFFFEGENPPKIYSPTELTGFFTLVIFHQKKVSETFVKHILLMNPMTQTMTPSLNEPKLIALYTYIELTIMLSIMLEKMTLHPIILSISSPLSISQASCVMLLSVNNWNNIINTILPCEVMDRIKATFRSSIAMALDCSVKITMNNNWNNVYSSVKLWRAQKQPSAHPSSCLGMPLSCSVPGNPELNLGSLPENSELTLGSILKIPGWRF